MAEETPSFWTDPVGESVRLVGMRGELDAATAPGFRSHMNSALDSGCNVIVDLRELVYFDSVGLTALIQAWHLARAHGREIAFVVNDPVGDRLRMRGVESFLPLAEDYDSALAQVSEPG